MPMEQETMGYLTYGFSIVMGISFIVILLLFIKRKSYRMAYGFVLGYLVFLAWAVNLFLAAINFDFNHPMASEEVSLKLSVAGIMWVISMLFLIFGSITFSWVKKS
ncbi:hypothetical protein [Bacillus sp. SM2101]|uniref:hypothetical protein n=1 Tax=Bacillus sp. SM2101 TaxID=2805366 RepID=UPI001BDEC88A|nr:hypothetical protein [Bacillus sp. SM2101]